MHEVSVIQALIEQVREHLPDGAALRDVTIEIGELEHLDETVMQTAWTALTGQSDLRGANLITVRVPLLMTCRNCGDDYEPEDRLIYQCPACGAVRPDVKHGSGVLLRSIEAETE